MSCPIFAKNLLNSSAIFFLSVILLLFILKYSGSGVLTLLLFSAFLSVAHVCFILPLNSSI